MRFTQREYRSYPAKARRRRGFALLLVLALLALLMILLLGLASFARVEGAVATQAQKQAQARQNARYALELALAQLQRHAGPDQRVTATAAAFSHGAGTTPLTGVWDASGTGPAPRAWLVSGNETDPLARRPDRGAAPGDADSAPLIGAQTSGVKDEVRVPLRPIRAMGGPGQATPATIGCYAWWVGDQGVKAPVALGDPTEAASLGPGASAEGRARLRQQLSLGAGPATFEPRDEGNRSFVGNVIAANQLAFLKTAGGAPLGLATLRANFHAWSPDNLAVLADTRHGGLRQDLSLRPDLLGAEFAAWADYRRYLEAPPTGAAETIRRRYRIGADKPRVAPVLTYFYLLVGVRKPTANAPYAVSVRWAAALWNPYSAALVPENLKLEISGLPGAVTIFSSEADTQTETDEVTFSLPQLYGSPLIVSLPWPPGPRATPQEESWLPGRVYNWVHQGEGSAPPGLENPGRFNSRDLGGVADGLTVAVPGRPSVNGGTLLGVRVGAKTTLAVKLRRANGDLLATYTSPTYDAVPRTAIGPANGQTSQLGFLFRLAESFDRPAAPGAWLTTTGRDPRAAAVSADQLVAVPNGTNPANYRNFITVSKEDRLLDRATNSFGYNEDAPVFELPRGPLLSLGAAQHFPIGGARPFAIGNPWGAETRVNGIRGAELFDRFYFSGLAIDVAPSLTGNRVVLPNPLLQAVSRKADGGTLTVADLRASPDAKSSKFLLQRGAFNVNSVNATAWAAVLRGVRFPAPAAFRYLDAEAGTGTAAEARTRAVQSGDAQFLRFSQSAQETYKAEPGNSGGAARTEWFRRGMRTLPPGQVAALAGKIAEAVKARQAAAGPFRSLEAFLAPGPGGGLSLLEQAIADAGINREGDGETIAFSSQFLTQGDVLTALAPVWFVRSDTFVIRAYGEAVNPATSAAEGRAWCEALVQRAPEYFDPSQAEETPPASLNPLNQSLGRRFKIISFRWLTRSDI